VHVKVPVPKCQISVVPMHLEKLSTKALLSSFVHNKKNEDFVIRQSIGGGQGNMIIQELVYHEVYQLSVGFSIY